MTMEAPTGKVIVMIIAYILLVLIPSSEACSASKKEGKFLEFVENNQKDWCFMYPRVNLTKSVKVRFYSRKRWKSNSFLLKFFLDIPMKYVKAYSMNFHSYASKRYTITNIRNIPSYLKPFGGSTHILSFYKYFALAQTEKLRLFMGITSVLETL